MNYQNYSVKAFTRFDIELVKSLCSCLIELCSDAKIMIFNELTGGYEQVTKGVLIDELNKSKKSYTGLDQIEICRDERILLAIAFHEDLCVLKITEAEKKQLNNKLPFLNLTPYSSKKE